MKIITISGSAMKGSSNARLLDRLSEMRMDIDISRCSLPNSLPLFQAHLDRNPLPPEVRAWREAVGESDAVIFCTPEYLHNIPAVLKNALEWLTTSGELANKKVLAMTFTPHEPRGEKALQSLIWSLNALDARIEGGLSVYKSEINLDLDFSSEIREILEESINMLLPQ